MSSWLPFCFWLMNLRLAFCAVAKVVANTNAVIKNSCFMDGGVFSPDSPDSPDASGGNPFLFLKKPFDCAQGDKTKKIATSRRFGSGTRAPAN